MNYEKTRVFLLIKPESTSLVSSLSGFPVEEVKSASRRDCELHGAKD
jgi:hypothetical protein